MSWDWGAVIALAALALGLFAGLIGVIWKMLNGRIDDLKEEVGTIYADFNTYKMEVSRKRDETNNRLFGDVEKLRDGSIKDLYEKVGDLEKLGAGLSGTFVSRSECNGRHRGGRFDPTITGRFPALPPEGE